MAEELEQIQEENIEPTQEENTQGEQVDQTEQTTQEPPTKASKLYNNLLKDGYTKQNLGSESDFIKMAITKEGAAKLHANLLKDGYTESNLGDLNSFTANLVPQPPVQKQTPLYTAKGFVEQKQKEEQAQPLPIAPKKEVIKPIVKQIPSITQYNRKEDENGFVSALGTTTDYAKHLYNKLIEGVGSLGAGALELQGMTTSALINAAQQITGDKSFNSQEFQNHINNEIVPKLKEKIKEVGQGASTAVFGLPGSKISEEREKKFNDNFLASSVAGVAEFAPAMPLGIVGMLAAGTDMGLQSINNTDAGKKLPESVKSIFAVATGTATALLTQLKLDKIFGKQTEKVASKLAVETLNKLLNESTEPITADAFNAALQNSAKSLKDKVVSSGGKLLKAGAVGSMFGGLNEATNLLAEDIANRSTKKEIFEPTSWGKVRGRIIKSAASMGVGGIVLGGAHIPFIKAEDYIKNKVSEAKSVDEINNLKREVAQQVQGGDVSIDNANRVLNLIDQYTKIHSSIPVDVPNKEKIVDKIKQRDDLHQQANEVLSEAQNLDLAFQEQKIKEAQVLTNAADDIHNQIAGKPVYKIGEQEVDRDTFNNYLDSEAAKQNKEDLYVENDDEMSTKLEKQGGKTTIDEESGLPFTTTKTTQYDTENITGIPSKIGGGQEPIQTQPIEGRGTQATSGGGVLQENVPSRQGEVGKEAQGEVEAPIEALKEVDRLNNLKGDEYFENSDKLNKQKKYLTKINIERHLSEGWDNEQFIKSEIDKFNSKFSSQAKKQNPKSKIPKIISVEVNSPKNYKTDSEYAREYHKDKNLEWLIKFDDGSSYSMDADVAMGNPYSAMMQAYLNNYHSINKSSKLAESIFGRTESLSPSDLYNYNPLKGEKIQGTEFKAELPKEEQPKEEKKTFSIDNKEDFYHGSYNKREGKLRANTAEQFGDAIYFTTSKEEAEGGYPYVTKVKLNIENPIYAGEGKWSEVEKFALEKENANKERNEDGKIIGEAFDLADIKNSKNISDAAKELGYDAIILRGEGNHQNETAVLDPSKIIYPEDISKAELPVPTEKIQGKEFTEEEDKKIKDIAINANLNHSNYIKSVPTNKKNKFGNNINKYEATNPFTKEKLIFEKQTDAANYVVKEISKAATKSGREEIYNSIQAKTELPVPTEKIQGEEVALTASIDATTKALDGLSKESPDAHSKIEELAGVMYHGTEADFDKFEKVGSRIPALGLGYYFTPTLEKAKQYGSKIKKIVLEGAKILNWNKLTDIEREQIKKRLEERVPRSVLGGLGERKEKIFTKEQRQEASDFYKQKREETDNYEYERGKARVKRDGDKFIVSWSEEGLGNINDAELLNFAQKYDNDIANEMGYDAAKYGNEIAVYDNKKIINATNEFISKEYHKILKVPEQERTEQQKKFILSVNDALAKSELPKGQEAKTGVQPSTEPISGRGAESTTPVLEKGEKVKQNKDTQSEFTTSSGRQKVNRVGDELVVTDAKTSKEVSRKTHNKAVREYIDNFDFTHGEEGESTTLSQDVNEMLTEVVENSNNPQQIAQIYAENDLPFTETAMTKDGMIAEYGLGSVSKDSYIRFGDRNKITRGMVSNFFAKKGETPMGIDAIAKDMSEHYFPEGDGTEITPQDIVDFMDTYDTRRKIEKEFAAKNPLLDLAKQKFKKLTGIELTKEVADKAFTQKIEKETQAEQNLLKQDYENAKQLEDEYWKQYEATNGFTKEVSLIEVDKGKEGITEERAKVEVPLAKNPFEKVPKTQVARDKYFKSTFGENAAKAEEIYNKYKDTNDFQAMQKEMQGEKVAEQPPVPPVVEKPKEEMPSEEEKWTAIRKEKLEEIKGVKEMFEKQTSKSWTKIQQEALEGVAKEFPKKTLSDAIRTKVERLAAKYDAREDYNPTAKDLAVIQEFKRQTESRITAAKEDLLSDNDAERFAAISEMESYENDLMNASKALFVQEAGRAFGFRQSESIKDENAGLQIRRMQLMKANGMEKLSDADNKFLESQWEKEKELMKREQEIREQSLKEGFDKEIAKLQEEYEAKLKEKKVSATDKKASDKLRKFAEKIRNSKTLDSLGLGAPIEGETKGISFNTKEALAKVIDKMADGMDKIEAITKVLKEYGLDKSKEFSDLVDKALIKIAKPDTEETLSKIKDLAEKTGEKNVTNEMVTKGFIKDYVNSFIGEVDKSNILNEAAAKLKEVLPDLDKRTLRNAFLKEGEFKQPTKKSLNEALNQAKRDLLKIEKEQSKKEATEDELQKKKLEQEKEKAQKSIKDYQRKLDNGEFEKEEPTVLKKQDAELIQINKEKNQIKSEFDKKRKELEEKNKHWLQRAADFARSTYIAALIGSPKTLAKVAYMSVIRPVSEITRKVVLGNLFKAIAPSYYEAALRGGESASLKSIEAGLGAYFRQMGEKKMQEKFQKSSNDFDQAAKKYYDAVNAKADEKTLSKLKQDMDNKRLAAMGNIVYQFIGGSSIKDALQSLINRANEIERQFGKTETESIKDGNKLDKLNYILGFIGRSHSAAKTFSGRFSYAASFMAKLEGAARDGSISDPNRIIEIAHESYLDWERGKYQQDNWVTKKWNDVVRSIKEKTVGKGEWSKYDKALEAILKTDVAITRVPVNILHEAVTEYTLGALRAPIIAYKEYNKAKGKAAEEGYSKTIDSKEFKARVKEIISQMDAEQAAKIYRLFTKGGLGAGLYGLALATGLVQFGVFPHKGQKKKKEEEYLKEGELNPGQIMFGKDRLGETASKIIEHSPSLWTTFMGLGIAKIYADDVKEGKMSAQAAWDAAYTHMQIIESSIPQSKVVSPLEISKQTGKAFAGKLSDYGMLDNYIDSKGAFINQEKKKLEMTTSEVARLKDYKVEPPRLGVRSQNKIEVDAKHPKVGLSKDGKPYAYMNDFEWDKFNQYRKDYINNALKEIYDAADGGDIKLTQENLTDALTRITKQATTIAKNKLVEDGLLPEKNKEDEEDVNVESINSIIKDIYQEAKE